MLEELKYEVFNANLDLVNHGLVLFTWGNVSAIDRKSKLVVIKPSGVSYETMKIDDMVVVDLDGNVIEGSLKPSSDTPTHLELYRKYENLGGVVHTHSTWATTLAQNKKSVKDLGTTHGDYFYGEIPCTRDMTKEEIQGEYEKNTGLVIIETFKDKDVLEVPAVLVASHGPFAFGKGAKEAVYNAVVLEQVSKMAYHNYLLDSNMENMDKTLLDKHFLRKHGKNAYYGQN